MSRRHLAMLSTPLTTIALLLALPVPGAHAAVTSGARLPVLRAPGPADVPRGRPVVQVYRLRPGDYLSKVALQRCGNPADWIGIWHATRPHIANPNVVPVGLAVTVACNHAGPGYAPARAWHRASSAGKVWGVTYGYPNYCGDGDGDGWDVPCSHRGGYRRASRRFTAPGSAGGYGNVSLAGYGGYQACVIQRESGGQGQVMNASGHYGLYQFDLGTWESGGGSAGDFGHASVAEQNRVFAAVYAARGTQPWTPSDGC